MFIPLHLLLIASPPQIPPCVQELSALLQREDFDAILTGAEACDQETGHPRALYFKGIAQLAKGQPDRAIESLQRYLASDPQGEPPRLREIAAVRLEQARSEVGVIEFRIEPDSSGGDTLVTIEREGWDEPIARFASKFEQRDGRAILVLPPGSYRVTARRAGFLPGRQEISIAAGGETVSVQLSLRLRPPPEVPPPTPEVPSTVVRKMKLGFGIAGGVAVAAGIVVPIVGAVRVRGLDGECQTAGADDPYAACRTAWKSAYRTRDAGLAVLGSGLGLLAGGLTWMVQDPGKRRSAFIAETVIGGIAMVGGFASLFATSRPFNELNGADDWDAQHEKIAGRVGPHAVSMTAFGLGLGLLTSAAVGLGVHRKYTGSLRAGAMTGPGQAGLMLSGSF